MNEYQENVYNFIKAFIKKKGFVPSIREIADGLGKGSTTIFEHLTSLEKLGYISRGRNVARSIKILK